MVQGDNMGTAHLRDVYFQRSNGEFILLVDSIEEEYVWLVIKDFLNKHNYKSYYTRSWEKDGIKWYDVGSHTEFFAWTKEEDLERYKANECN